MQKVLFKAVLTALLCITAAPQLFSFSKEAEPREMKYEYFVETDLSRDMFSQAFCKRLATEHNWVQVKSTVGPDETYTASFRFVDDESNNWRCEVRIKDITSIPTGLPRKMDIVMTMIPVFGS